MSAPNQTYERSELPRGRCPACGQDVALRRNGVTREHRVYLPQREQRPSEHLGRTRVCDGSGQPPGAAEISGQTGVPL